MLKNMRLNFIIVILMLFTLSGCTFHFVDDSFNNTYNPDGIDRVSVKNTSGDINVTSSSSGFIEVKALIKAHTRIGLTKVEVVVSENNGELKFESDYLDPFTHAVVKYDIALPDNIQLDAENTSGNVDVNGITTVSNINVTSGNIEVKVCDSISDLETTSGNIWADILNDDPDTTIKTTSGNITVYVDSYRPSITTSTTSGYINNHGVSTGSNGTIKLSATSGNIHIYPY
ncbi:MAG: DUF4097 domain-containing protein [Spirochaetes bacterium]|nr:DUF4097 domain-containing protein [Spirochaetota bacterium]